jgi:hypothetical protein
MEKYKLSTKSIRAKEDLGGVKVADSIKDAGHSNTDRWIKSDKVKEGGCRAIDPRAKAKKPIYRGIKSKAFWKCSRW